MRTFNLKFFKQFLPVTSQMLGRKLLIGGNLGSHFSVKVSEICKASIYHLITQTYLSPWLKWNKKTALILGAANQNLK